MKSQQLIACTPYLNRQQCANLALYRYAAEDRGLSYARFWSPFANYCVSYIPEWVAPNTITLLGFIFSVLPPIVLFSKYGTKFENGDTPIDRWFFVLYAVFFFLYRLCDEMDGKQARRTKNSSPLGMVFDHGCDAYGMGLHVVSLIKCLQMGQSLDVMICAIVSASSFHISTLEEYYVGGCYLGMFNAVSDGSVGIISVLLSMAVFGNDFHVGLLPYAKPYVMI